MNLKSPPPSPIIKFILRLKSKSFSVLPFVIFVLTFFVLLLSSHVGQIKIKEKVEIKPKTDLSKTKGASSIALANHTMRFEMTWPGDAEGFFELGQKNFYPTDTYDTYYFECGFYTGEQRNESSGYLNVTYSGVKPTLYLFNFQVYDDAAANDQMIMKVYWDGTLVETLYGFDDGYDDNFWIGSFAPPSYNDFYIQKTNPFRLNLGGTTSFIFEPDYYAICDDEDYYEDEVYSDWNILTDNVRLTITKGSEYISLYNESLMFGASKTITLDKVEEFDPEYNRMYSVGDYIKYYNAQPNTVPYFAEVKVDANGVEETIQVELAPCIPSTIFIAPNGMREYIHHGLKSVIPISVKGWCNLSSIENLTFEAEITQGTEYGVLINPTKNPEIGNVKLTNITHNSGYFELVYYAKGTDPYQNENVLITITPSNPDIDPIDINLILEPMPLVVKFAKEPIVLGETPNYTNEIKAGETLRIITSLRGATSSANQELDPNTHYPYVDIWGLEYFELVDDRDYGTVKGIDANNEVGVPKEGVWISDIKAPIELIAIQDVDLDSVNFRITVRANVDGANQSTSMNSSLSGENSNGEVDEIAYIQNENKQTDKKLAYKSKRRKNKIERLSDDRNRPIGVRPKSIYAQPNKQLVQNKPNNNAPNKTNASMSGTNGTAGVNAELWGLGVIDLMGEDELDHFAISIIPDTLAAKDTLAFTETAKLIIQAKDASDNDVDFDSTKALNFEVTTNISYGTFIKPNGDTLKTTPVELQNITYADAKAGKIKFAAVKANPDSVVKCNIRVVLQEDTTRNGEREAVVLEQTLKIVIDQIFVRPTYFNRNGVRIGNESESQIELNISMTRGGKANKQHLFILSNEFVDNSGGHNHTNERMDSDANLGYFLKQNDNTHYRTAEEKTDSNGSFNDFTFIASELGDSMKIYLNSSDINLLKDSVIIVERVPDLVELQEGTNYVLVGAPHNHSGTNDPCRNPPTSEHDSNHFGTTDLVQAIQNIANDYIQIHPGVRIRVNDMSLPYGGMFDYQNTWDTPHRSHRLGQNADIGFTGVDENGNCVDINRRDLEAIIIRHCTRSPYVEGDHYHIYVY